MSNESIQHLSRRGFLTGVGAAAGAYMLSDLQAAGITTRLASSTVVRMGIVGGNFGSTFQWHLDPNCKVTAVCDLRDDRLKDLVHAYGPAKPRRIHSSWSQSCARNTISKNRKRFPACACSIARPA